MGTCWKTHGRRHSRPYKCITNYPKLIPKTPKSTVKFDLDLIFQGHTALQSSKMANFQEFLLIT